MRIFLVSFILLCSVSPVWAEQLLEVRQLEIVGLNGQGYKVMVEIAKTRQQREKGLMHRTSLDRNTGMLFIFDVQKKHAVWMKNTLIALDVAFISEKGVVVSVYRNLQPCIADPCQIYNAAVKAKYMLEVNAGFFVENNIKEGYSINFL